MHVPLFTHVCKIPPEDFRFVFASPYFLLKINKYKCKGRVSKKVLWRPANYPKPLCK